MIDGKILISNPDITATALSTLEQMINEDTEIVTILAGDEGTVEQANEFAEKLTENILIWKSRSTKEISLSILIYFLLNNFCVRISF